MPIWQRTGRNEPENPPGIETELPGRARSTGRGRNEPENPPGIETLDPVLSLFR